MLRGIEDRVRRPFDFIGNRVGEHEAAQTLWEQCRSLMDIGYEITGNHWAAARLVGSPMEDMTVSQMADFIEIRLQNYKAELLSPLEQLAEIAPDD